MYVLPFFERHFELLLRYIYIGVWLRIIHNVFCIGETNSTVNISTVIVYNIT